ncbi:MAG: ferrous iron transport protein A [Deltaproteobacteria bacterium]|nr:ferrous iron transport protein A [Deltaproteobacteria bacterium]
MSRSRNTGKATLPLRMAREGERVRIISLNGGRGFHDRLAGLGLRIGEQVEIIQNRMDGKLLLGHEGTRLFLGGGMAHKIQVVAIERGGDK